VAKRSSPDEADDAPTVGELADEGDVDAGVGPYQLEELVHGRLRRPSQERVGPRGWDVAHAVVGITDPRGHGATVTALGQLVVGDAVVSAPEPLP
jgi:hypothetical protein